MTRTPEELAARQLKAAARTRPWDEHWAWDYCRVTRTLTPRLIGGYASYTLSVEVNGLAHSLASPDKREGKRYTVYLELATDLPAVVTVADSPEDAFHAAARLVEELQKNEAGTIGNLITSNTYGTWWD